MTLWNPLTKTGDRRLLQELTRQALALGTRRGHSVALLHLRIGPAEPGDRERWLRGEMDLTRSVPALLESLLRESDALTRLGRDEFGILLTEVWEEEGAARVACRILEALSRPLQGRGGDLHVRASIGIAVAPMDGTAHERLVRLAHSACVRAAEEGTGFALSSDARTQVVRNRLNLEVDLGLAPEQGQFQLRYQPVVRLADGRLAGVEALTYWPHRERGVVPPGEFIPLAEQTGRILSLDRWALGAAVGTARDCFHNGEEGWVSVNLSARTLHHPELVSHIADQLMKHQLPPRRLVVEVTESTAMRDLETSIRALRALRQIGVRVAVDDFGSGYSSLRYLRRLPLDILKLDRSFARDIGRDRSCEQLVDSVIKLTHDMGLEIVVEGVEKAEQMAWLANSGCDLIQGFFISRPVPLEGLAAVPLARAREDGIQATLAI